MSPPFDPGRTTGAVAQLGERLNRTQEADGSIPFSSTRSFGNHFVSGSKGSLGNDCSPLRATQEAIFPPDSTPRTRQSARGQTGFEVIGQHVIREPAEARVVPARIQGVLASVAQASERREVDVTELVAAKGRASTFPSNCGL